MPDMVNMGVNLTELADLTMATMFIHHRGLVKAMVELKILMGHQLMIWVQDIMLEYELF